jgi:hypothetical protein
MMQAGILPADIPSNPHNTYRNNGWLGMGDWLGTETIAPRLREYRPFPKARAFARKLKLKCGAEWKAFCKGEMPQLGRLPKDIPVSPNGTYAEQGWSGWGDWLGTGTVADRLRKYLSFSKARSFVRKLKLKSGAGWSAYCKGDLLHLGCLPENIPAAPWQTYANQGWAGMGDWLGTGTIAPRLREYRPFPKARAFARSLRLRSSAEWKVFCKGEMPQLGHVPPDIPSNPNRTYSDKGWISMGDWLGTGRVADQLRQYRPFQKARTYVRSLKLKNQTEWASFCKGEMRRLGRLPEDIPAAPWQTYADKGWSGMGDWLGTDHPRVSKSPKRKS